MIPRYSLLSGRIHQDLAQIERGVDRVELAILTRNTIEVEGELLLDSAALNLHDFYNGLERIFIEIASHIDQTVPSGTDSHRALLRQMTIPLPELRPPVLSMETAAALDEYLRFRHVVRHTYAFGLDPERVEQLTSRLRPVFRAVDADLAAFVTFLERVANGA
jgi:hypothetical protein